MFSRSGATIRVRLMFSRSGDNLKAKWTLTDLWFPLCPDNPDDVDLSLGFLRKVSEKDTMTL